MIRRTWGSLDTRGRVLAVIVLMGAIITTFGIQQARYQQQQEEFNQRSNALFECVSDWGDHLISDIYTARRLNTAISEAETKRDDAVDNVLLVVIALQAVPPEANEQDFSDALMEFVRTKTALVKEKRQAARARASNPYEKMNCG